MRRPRSTPPHRPLLPRHRRLVHGLAAITMLTVLVIAAGYDDAVPDARADTVSTSFLPATYQTAGASAYTISGLVREAGSQRPLANVQVSAEFGGNVGVVIAATSANGLFTIRGPSLAQGTRVPMMYRRIGYAAHQDTLMVSGDSLQVSVQLSPTQTRLFEEMVVQNASTTNPVATMPAIRGAPYGAAGKVAGGVARGVAGDANARLIEQSRLPATIRDESQRPRGDRGMNAHDTALRVGGDREQYDRIHDNPFLAVAQNELSTFSVDVDRASYGNVRRFLTQGQRPPADAVRIEELVNYFPYTLNAPRGRDPVAITTEVAPAPWEPRHHLVRIALQARRIETAQLPASNLVFLIDVSGSMSSPDKLPLVKGSLRLLVEQLRHQDRVAMVVYAGAAGLVLPSTSGADKAQIMAAIDRLESGGSTAGGAGLELAYRTAREGFMRDGNNRVILATDGDFNVGVSSDAAMERLIESKRSEGTYLTVLGYGRGNYQDAKMEKMAKVGNGNYAYVDDLAEARKVLVQEMGATLVTVANDVKLQIEFNPARVASYRLIGYEDRLLRNEDFVDDKKDAGDMGAGHTVTALYEVVPVGVHGTVPVRPVDSLRYLPTTPARSVATGTGRSTASGSNELLFVKLRYKQPGEATSRLLTQPVYRPEARTVASNDFRFAAAVASFGMVLRDSEYKGASSIQQVIELATGALGNDAGGYRREFLGLAERWRELGVGIAAGNERRDRD